MTRAGGAEVIVGRAGGRLQFRKIMNNWIKVSERKPDWAHCPIWVCLEGDKFATMYGSPVELSDDYLWCPIVSPTPPAKPTRQELDSRAMLTAWKRQGIDYAYDEFNDIPLDFQDGWFLALKHLRAERKDLQ